METKKEIFYCPICNSEIVYLDYDDGLWGFCGKCDGETLHISESEMHEEQIKDYKDRFE